LLLALINAKFVLYFNLNYKTMKKYLAEMIGTMVLVLMGCGTAVSLGCDPLNNIPAVKTIIPFFISFSFC
jgi:glycerol uptake facilitator-like aquaporin